MYFIWEERLKSIRRFDVMVNLLRILYIIVKCYP